MSRKENVPIKQNTDIRKQLIRNVSTQPTRKIQVINHNRCDDDEIDMNRKPQSNPLRTIPAGASKFAKPQLCTTLLLANKLDAIALSEAKPIRNFKNLPQQTQAVVNEKALKKLNFTPDRNIYHHLIPINVNDSVLDVKPRHRPKKRESVPADIGPTLHDYLRPAKPLEHRLSLNDDVIDTNDFRKPDFDNFRQTYEFYEQRLYPRRLTIPCRKSREQSN